MQESSFACPRNQQRSPMWLGTFVTLAVLPASVSCRGEVQRSVASDLVVGADLVQDTRTSLTWQRMPNAVEISQDEARAYCDGISLGGGRWRLPSVEEMLSVVYFKPTSLGDVDAFPATAAQLFWSSSWRKVVSVKPADMAIRSERLYQGTFTLGRAHARCVTASPIRVASVGRALPTQAVTTDHQVRPTVQPFASARTIYWVLSFFWALLGYVSSRRAVIYLHLGKGGPALLRMVVSGTCGALVLASVFPAFEEAPALYPFVPYWLASLVCFVLFVLTRQRSQRTPLHRAAENGDISDVETVLKRGADVNAPTGYGFTPLHLAALGNRPDAAKALIEKGANLEAKNAKGNTALHCAAEVGSDSVVMILVSAGADVNARGTFYETPLHWAATKGHLKVVELLVNAGARTAVMDNKGISPRDCAMMKKFGDIVKLLDAHAE